MYGVYVNADGDGGVDGAAVVAADASSARFGGDDRDGCSFLVPPLLLMIVHSTGGRHLAANRLRPNRTQTDPSARWAPRTRRPTPGHPKSGLALIVLATILI